MSTTTGSLRSTTTASLFFPEYLYTQFLKDNYNQTQIKKLEITIKRIFKATFPQDTSYNSLKFLDTKAILPYLKRNKTNLPSFLLVITTLLKVPSGEITEINKISIPFKQRLKEAAMIYQAAIQSKPIKQRQKTQRGKST